MRKAIRARKAAAPRAMPAMAPAEGKALEVLVGAEIGSEVAV